jgi:tetratricopeptide (TPR) repeat protein
MRGPNRRSVGMAAMTVACVAVGLVFAVPVLVPTPSLEKVGSLVASGRYDLARACVEDYLREFPEHPRARLMAAEILLNQPGPQPESALQHLGRFKSRDRKLSAVAKLDEGKAAYLLDLYDRAETCWLRALELDPRIPEASWALLDLYYLEGRRQDARRLALKQHAVEPDPHDRVHLLLELVRQDAEPPDPSSITERFRAAIHRNPGGVHASIAYGLSRIHASQAEEGLMALRGVLSRHPDNLDAWDALLTGLDDAGRASEMGEALARVPPTLAGDARLLRHRGREAQERRDWPAAVQAYRQAFAARPDDLVVAYRLVQALRRSGDLEEARQLEIVTRSAQSANTQLPELYKEADGTKDFGIVPHNDLYRRLADNRERLGRRDEARAWHLLILENNPGDPDSKAAVERLR